MSVTSDSTVGSVATQHPLATRVFARHGIDFCCGGGRPLEKVCQEKGLDVASVIGEIEQQIGANPGSEARWDEESIDALIQHILKNYHEPLEDELPRIEQMARKVQQVHGEKDPQRFRGILDTFLALKADLEQHFPKEEQILFPMILRGEGAMAAGPISVMEMEHETVGDMLRRLSELTWNYEAPEEACNTWRALWAALADLERSLHEHIHLENNILFKRVLSA